jgi:NADH dehydrogenase FAD-containing subunit
VSPRPYFVFTPLLNDSAVGTLEFRNVLESIRKKNTKVEFLQGWADDVNFADKTVTVEPNVLDQNVGRAMVAGADKKDMQKNSMTREDLTATLSPTRFQLGGQGQVGGTGAQKVPTFPIRYDKLVIAVGCYSQTFGTPGVKENALFLKDVNDARRIRRRILDLFELAKLPFIPEETKRHLLHFAIVGGGPTGIEFAACLSDLAKDDLSRMYPDLMQYLKISLYDVAPKVLPMFDASLADYAVKQYKRKNVDIKTSHHVVRLRKGLPNDQDAKDHQEKQIKHRVYTLETKEEGDVGIGMCVWSTGNQENPFVEKALNHVRRYPSGSANVVTGEISDPMKRQWTIQRDPKSGLILVDDHFRVQLQTQGLTPATKGAEAIMQDVYALGDTTIMKTGRLPGTAQVANQQALWLAKNLNKHPEPSAYAAVEGFGFKNLGVMTYLGGSKAVFQAPSDSEGHTRGIKGWIAFLIWRGAYLTMTLSWRNKFLVPMHWLAVKVFGRDVSRF